MMNTNQKKALLADVRRALHAVGRVLDGGHDLDLAFGVKNVEALRGSCIEAMAGFAVLQARLEAEIGTDNL